MSKNIYILILLLSVSLLSSAQKVSLLVSDCARNAGTNTKYLKDFRIQLGKAVSQEDLRFKANMSLWKNTKYRFTMCSSEGSKGQLILSLKDDANKTVVSSFDKKSGKTYAFIDFTCNKSGIYQLNYDFTGGQMGSGVGVVSMIR
jgi:hypothetical protein